MKRCVKIGLVIADDTEYAPVAAYCLQNGGTECRLLHHPAVRYTVCGEATQIDMIVVYCGIGKVNAATVSAYLCAAEGVEMIVNCGLSGGFSGMLVGDIVAGTGFVEHDFDLTPIGYQPGEKPGQTWFYKADMRFVDDLQKKYGCKTGVMVSGDCFVSDSRKAKALAERWNAVCCDMESAAIASVCHGFSIPCVCIRRISDGADDAAAGKYRDTVMDKQTWMTLSVKWIESLPCSIEF